MIVHGFFSRPLSPDYCDYSGLKSLLCLRSPDMGSLVRAHLGYTSGKIPGASSLLSGEGYRRPRCSDAAPGPYRDRTCRAQAGGTEEPPFLTLHVSVCTHLSARCTANSLVN